MSGDHGLEGRFEQFRSDVNSKLDGIGQALQELIRLDGDIKRQQDAIVRIGRQVDSHETRMRDLEKGSALNSRSVGRFDRLVDRVLMVLVGALVMYAISGGLPG